MMMQKEVREIIFKEGLTGRDSGNSGNSDDLHFIPQVNSMIRDYFIRNAKEKNRDYDPETEADMFLNTLKGFAVTLIFSDIDDDEIFNRSINRIIEMYK